eukprot:826773-Amphidinium_carterae.1
MDGEAREPLLHNSCDGLATALSPDDLTRRTPLLLVAGQRQEMDQRGCCGVVREGQAKDATNWVHEDTTHKEVPM